MGDQAPPQHARRPQKPQEQQSLGEGDGRTLRFLDGNRLAGLGRWGMEGRIGLGAGGDRGLAGLEQHPVLHSGQLNGSTLRGAVRQKRNGDGQPQAQQQPHPAPPPGGVPGAGEPGGQHQDQNHQPAPQGEGGQML